MLVKIEGWARRNAFIFYVEVWSFAMNFSYLVHQNSMSYPRPHEAVPSSRPLYVSLLSAGNSKWSYSNRKCSCPVVERASQKISVE